MQQDPQLVTYLIAYEQPPMHRKKPPESYTAKSHGVVSAWKKDGGFIFSEWFLAFSKSYCFVIRNIDRIK